MVWFTLCCQSVLRADSSQRPLTLHTASPAGSQENTGGGGVTSPCKKGHSFYFICCFNHSILPVKRMQQSVHSLRDGRRPCRWLSRLKTVQPGSCASIDRLHSLMSDWGKAVYTLEASKTEVWCDWCKRSNKSLYLPRFDTLSEFQTMNKCCLCRGLYLLNSASYEWKLLGHVKRRPS